MSIFEEAKQINLIDTMKLYGFSPIKKGHDFMISCPFHKDDDTPSMILHDTYFNCFACNTGGDVIKFVELYFHLKPIEAAKKLLSDFGLSTDDTVNIQTVKAENLKLEEEAEFLNKSLNAFYSNCCRLFHLFDELLKKSNEANIPKCSYKYNFIRFNFDFFDRITEDFINSEVEYRITLLQNAAIMYNSDWEKVNKLCLKNPI